MDGPMNGGNASSGDLEKATKLSHTDPVHQVIPPLDSQRYGESLTNNDPSNPYRWPKWKKTHVVSVCILLIFNCTIGSSISSGAAQPTAHFFNVGSQEELVLPTSLYLVGYVLGPFVFSPLSETIGRKLVLLGTFLLYTLFALASALAPTFACLVIFRLLCGIGGSTPLSITGGVCADIFEDPGVRGLVNASWMIATCWGPLLGPIASGYAAVDSWRWAYWVQLIVAGATWPFALALPETYAPVVLKRKARRFTEPGTNTGVVKSKLDKTHAYSLAVELLSRPARMFFTEAIVLFSCLHMALVYAISYVFIQAFPVIYIDTYGFTYGQDGLAFVAIGIGGFLAGIIYLGWDYILYKARRAVLPPRWVSQEEYRRVPLACIGGPALVISLFWQGWTARPNIHWIVPILAGIPFGIAYLLIFIAMTNYMIDAYRTMSASALAASNVSRSLLGALLPFATRPMFERLGIAWACSLLGFVALLMVPIPFVFIKYGDRIRANSKFCQELRQQDAERLQAKPREAV